MTLIPSYSLANLLPFTESVTLSDKIKETIAGIMAKAKDKEPFHFVLWDLIDGEVAKSSPDEKPTWIAFRKTFQDDVTNYYIKTLETIFAGNPVEGYKAWTQVLIDGLCFFRDSFCIAISNHPFLFPQKKTKRQRGVTKNRSACKTWTLGRSV